LDEFFFDLITRLAQLFCFRAATASKVARVYLQPYFFSDEVSGLDEALVDSREKFRLVKELLRAEEQNIARFVVRLQR